MLKNFLYVGEATRQFFQLHPVVSSNEVNVLRYCTTRVLFLRSQHCMLAHRGQKYHLLHFLPEGL
jgi:hypothetical protein